MARPKKYPPELIERGIRLALESERPIAHIAHDLGVHPETLHKRVRQAEADSGGRPELLSSQAAIAMIAPTSQPNERARAWVTIPPELSVLRTPVGPPPSGRLDERMLRS